MNRRGFTIIETLIAMIILSGALIVLSNTWNGALLSIRKSRHLNTVTYLIQKKMTELDLKYRNKVAELPDEDGGAFDDYKEYTWKMKARKLVLPDLTVAMTAQSGGAQGQELSMVKQLSDYIEKTVKEVQVTVEYKAHKKTLKYQVTTYFVDFEQNFSLGGGQ